MATKKIRMLTSCMWWEEGEEYIVETEDSYGLYFDGIDNKWTIVEHSREGVDFEYVEKYGEEDS